MAEQTDNAAQPQQNQPSGQRPEQKTQSRFLLTIVVVFAVFVVIVFLTQKKKSINWIEDYEAGMALAREQGKPVLLAFYKPNSEMSTDTFQNTYNDPAVKKFVETNFVPILINVDEQPDVAAKYNIDYYPTHYVTRAGSDKLAGPRLGYDPPGLFIKEMQSLLDQLNTSEK